MWFGICGDQIYVIWYLRGWYRPRGKGWGFQNSAGQRLKQTCPAKLWTLQSLAHRVLEQCNLCPAHSQRLNFRGHSHFKDQYHQYDHFLKKQSVAFGTFKGYPYLVIFIEPCLSPPRPVPPLLHILVCWKTLDWSFQWCLFGSINNMW